MIFFQDNTTHITMNFFFRMPSDFLRNNKMIFFSTFGSALFFFCRSSVITAKNIEFKKDLDFLI